MDGCLKSDSLLSGAKQASVSLEEYAQQLEDLQESSGHRAPDMFEEESVEALAIGEIIASSFDEPKCVVELFWLMNEQTEKNPDFDRVKSGAIIPIFDKGGVKP